MLRLKYNACINALLIVYYLLYYIKIALLYYNVNPTSDLILMSEHKSCTHNKAVTENEFPAGEGVAIGIYIFLNIY